jgi:serine/threonine protein kinase
MAISLSHWIAQSQPTSSASTNTASCAYSSESVVKSETEIKITSMFHEILSRFDISNSFQWQPLSVTLHGKKITQKTIYLCDTILFQSGQSEVYPALKTAKLGFKTFVYMDISKKKSPEQLSSISSQQIGYFKEAATLKIAPKIYETKDADSSKLFVKFASEGDLIGFIAKNPDLSFQCKLSIAKKFLNKLQLLHNCLEISHLDLTPYNVLINCNEKKELEVFFCDFGLSTKENLIDTLIGYNPKLPTPELIFKEYAAPYDADKLIINTKQLDLHLAGQTLYFLFKGHLFFDDFCAFKEKRCKDEGMKRQFDDIMDLDDLSVIMDDLVRDFLDCKVVDILEPIKLILRGLLRTLPEDRYNLEKVIGQLNEIF